MERLPCDPNTPCPLRDTDRGCFEDVHHLYFPRKVFRTAIERAFRELDENKVKMCRNWHNTDHAVFEAPDKPDVEIMRMAIAEERNKRTQNGQV